MKMLGKLYRSRKVYCDDAAMRRMGRSIRFAIMLFLLAAAIPSICAAGEPVQSTDWQFNASLYMWGAGIGGETPQGDTIDVGFDDLLDNLNFAFMGGLGARKGRWSLLADAIYLNVEAENNGSITVPIGPGRTINVDAELKLQSWVVTSGVGYTIFDNGKFQSDVIAGARYLWMKPEFRLDLTGVLVKIDKKISASADVWDGILGIRGSVNLDKRWYIPYYADIGTGESKFTWQAMTGVGYRFSSFDVVVAYRYLYWNFESNPVLDHLDISGPLVGIRYYF